MSKLYRCTECRKKKQPCEFYLRSNGLVGEYKCKACILEKRRTKYYSDYDNVREINRKAVAAFQKRNPDKNRAKVAKYRAAKANRVPRWITADELSKIRSIYKLCTKISKLTGIPHEVDHIIPLRGKTVSGLHVLSNLRVIPKIENLKKSNLLIEDIV
jgi:hypothetical protein